VGVTGTNGKTTVVTLLFELFSKLGYKCGMLSTVENRIADRIIASTHTTPDALAIQSLMAEMVKAGCTHCFMEVSSHAVVQQRIAGIQFTGAIFTNITPEHLDFHGSFKNYIQAKKGFFDMLGSQAFALVNADDSNAKVMVQNTKAFVRSYSLEHITDFHARILANGVHGLQLEIDGRELWSVLMGRFNASNLLCVYAVAQIMGESPEEILLHASTLKPPKGRFERYFSDNGITAIVDYAHTPDALKNVLDTINQIRTGNEHVVTVVGCGGNRDKEKRPEMAKVACKGSNKVVITSDNPRNEEPDSIIDDMMQGVSALDYKKVKRIVDRREAIAFACSTAAPGDIILIAGKGHENYQEVKGVKHPFDDREEIMRNLKITV
jgi:UDP-N-acetylmuramoyl-L-alanyl-D-glutamate--2,6-diaminopimelate ligase